MSNSVVYQTQMMQMLHFIKFDCFLILYNECKMYKYVQTNTEKYTMKEIMEKYLICINKTLIYGVFLLLFIVSMQKQFRTEGYV